MIDKHLIEKKLRRIEEFLREVASADVPEDFDTFSGNIVFKRFVERNIELAIEQMIDICKHLVSALDLQEPETYAECFEILGRADILPAETLETFKSMARYRNFLIHAYDGIDDTVTYGIYKKRLGDFHVFVGVIRKYMANEFHCH